MAEQNRESEIKITTSTGQSSFLGFPRVQHRPWLCESLARHGAPYPEALERWESWRRGTAARLSPGCRQGPLGMQQPRGCRPFPALPREQRSRAGARTGFWNSQDHSRWERRCVRAGTGDIRQGSAGTRRQQRGAPACQEGPQRRRDPSQRIIPSFPKDHPVLPKGSSRPLLWGSRDSTQRLIHIPKARPVLSSPVPTVPGIHPKGSSLPLLPGCHQFPPPCVSRPFPAPLPALVPLPHAEGAAGRGQRRIPAGAAAKAPPAPTPHAPRSPPRAAPAPLRSPSGWEAAPTPPPLLSSLLQGHGNLPRLRFDLSPGWKR